MSRRRQRCPGLQPLEPRCLLAIDTLAVAADLDGQVTAASEVLEDAQDLHAGSSLVTAHPLGLVTGPVLLEGHVSPVDRLEYYEFQVSGPAEVNAVLFGADAKVALGLYDTEGRLLDFSNQGSAAVESIRQTLSTGSYYLMVINSSDVVTGYQLAVTSSGHTNLVQVTDGQDQGGDSFGRATDLGTLSGSVTYWDRVGGSDPADVFRMTVAQPQSVTLQLDQLTANVDLHVFTTDGRIVQHSRNQGSAAESLQLDLAVGEYFLLLFPADGTVSDYRFQINAAAAPNGSPPPASLDGGDTFTRATDLGTLQTTVRRSETIGGSDTTDVFRFTLSDARSVHVELRGLSADIDLYVFDAHFQLLGRNYQGGTLAEQLDLDLRPDVYYALIIPHGDVRSAYELIIDPQAVPSPPIPAPPPPNSTIPIPLPDVADYGSGREWYLNRIHAPEAWAYGFTGKNLVVAVIDSGVDRTHPDLIGSMWKNAREVPGDGIDNDGNGYVDDVFGWDFVDDDASVDDPRGHGTHIAGTIAATRNSFGATGVAYDAKIMPLRVLEQDGGGKTSWVAAAIRYAADMGADIINLSLMSDGYSSAIYNALLYARQKGLFVAAAAGNDSQAVPRYPARHSAELDNVISVGAYDQQGQIADFSNGVGNSGAVQLDAPGIGIYNTLPDGSYGYWFGTSMATPQVASMAALIWQSNPKLTAAQVRVALVQMAERGIGGSDSRGGLDGAGSVALAANTRPANPLPSSPEFADYLPVVEDLTAAVAGRPHALSAQVPLPAANRLALRHQHMAPLALTSAAPHVRRRQIHGPLASARRVSAVDRVLAKWSRPEARSDSAAGPLTLRPLESDLLATLAVSQAVSRG